MFPRMKSTYYSVIAQSQFNSQDGVWTLGLGSLRFLSPVSTFASNSTRNSCNAFSHILLGLPLDAIGRGEAGCFPKNFLNRLIDRLDFLLRGGKKTGRGTSTRDIGGVAEGTAKGDSGGSCEGVVLDSMSVEMAGAAGAEYLRAKGSLSSKW